MSRRKQRLSRAISKRQLIVEEFEPRAMLASLPVAVGESYDATQNRMLQIAAPGVLANDADADQDPLTAELVSDAQHGTVTMNPDGSFSYVPDLGYVGADSFTYRAVTLNPSTVFTVDRSLSSVNLDAILDTDFGRDSDDDSSSITGTITKRLSPNDAPFDEIHITDLDLVVADGLSLQFRFGFGLAGLNVDLPPDPRSTSAATPSPRHCHAIAVPK